MVKFARAYAVIEDANLPSNLSSAEQSFWFRAYIVALQRGLSERDSRDEANRSIVRQKLFVEREKEESLE